MRLSTDPVPPAKRSRGPQSSSRTWESGLRFPAQVPFPAAHSPEASVREAAWGRGEGPQEEQVRTRGPDFCPVAAPGPAAPTPHAKLPGLAQLSPTVPLRAPWCQGQRPPALTGRRKDAQAGHRGTGEQGAGGTRPQSGPAPPCVGSLRASLGAQCPRAAEGTASFWNVPGQVCPSLRRGAGRSRARSGSLPGVPGGVGPAEPYTLSREGARLPRKLRLLTREDGACGRRGGWRSAGHLWSVQGDTHPSLTPAEEKSGLWRAGAGVCLCAHVCVRTHMEVCMSVCTLICVHAHVYVFVCTWMCVLMRVCLCMCFCVQVCTCRAVPGIMGGSVYNC